MGRFFRGRLSENRQNFDELAMRLMVNPPRSPISPVARSERSELPAPRLERPPRIIAITGGKGGIGKTLFSVNLGVVYAKLGMRVALVDLDFGAPNLHTLLGVDGKIAGIAEFLKGQSDQLKHHYIPAHNVTLVPGGLVPWSEIVPNYRRKQQLFLAIKNLPFEVIILDLGPGTRSDTLDFHLMADLGVVVSTAEPTAIENNYAYLNALFARKLQLLARSTKSTELVQWLDDVFMESRRVAPIVVLERLAAQGSAFARQALPIVRRFVVGFILNQTRIDRDSDIGVNFCTIASRYFGFRADFLGSACFDDNAWKATRLKSPVVQAAPDSRVAHDTRRVAENLRARGLEIDSSSSWLLDYVTGLWTLAAQGSRT